jgi:hypothetical protein
MACKLLKLMAKKCQTDRNSQDIRRRSHGNAANLNLNFYEIDAKYRKILTPI